MRLCQKVQSVKHESRLVRALENRIFAPGTPLSYTFCLCSTIKVRNPLHTTPLVFGSRLRILVHESDTVC